MEPMISWARMVSGKLSRSKVLQTTHFAKWVANMVRKQGTVGLVLYLKTAHVMLMQSLPGSELHCGPREIGKTAVARGGSSIPRVIPSYARRLIRLGDRSTIRFWLTMLGLYRMLLIRPTFKINTITDPGVTLSPTLIGSWVRFLRGTFIPQLTVITGVKLLDAGTSILERPAPFAILKSGADMPSVLRGPEGEEAPGLWPKTSYATRFNSASRWVSGEWGWSLFRYLSLVPGGEGTTKSLWRMMEEVAEAKALVKSHTDENRCDSGSKANGRLSVKIEPAGKARVFAMVDFWTQVALKPLHIFLFDLLKEIDQDGTHNQLQPITRLLKKVNEDQTIYSFDLSAATDRLPVLLQGLLLWQIFGRQFAAQWRALLVSRKYYLGAQASKMAGLGDRGTWLSYNVGQPMGAFSSWAMLAITHHALVQFAAHRVGWDVWFDLYGVLGDDVVIADDAVAREYRKLCKEIGLGIGIAKSLIARRKTLEFAKRLFFQGEIISGLPIKFWAAAQKTMGVAHALSAWYPSGSLSNFVRALGVGFKGASKVGSSWNCIPRRLQVLCVLLTQPITGGRFAARTWLDWLCSSSPTCSDHQGDLDALTSFNPWATSLIEEVLNPARERTEEIQADLFFNQTGQLDPCGRAVNVIAGKALASATKSIDLAVESMKHLQRLNVKFNAVQCSAIFQQVVRAADKVDLISPSAVKALKRKDETEVAPIMDFYQLWVRLRRRLFPQLGK